MHASIKESPLGEDSDAGLKKECEVIWTDSINVQNFQTDEGITAMTHTIAFRLG